MAAMQDQLKALAAQPQPQPQAQPAAPAASGSALSAKIGGTSVVLYGYADLSADAGNDGKQSVREVSSNLSYVGVKGSRELGASGLKGIFQVETLANISGTPTETGGLASRNSFVGIEGGFG